MSNVIRVYFPDREYNEHLDCTIVQDKCDRSIRIEDSHGDTVAHYDSHTWVRVVQEVTQ